MTPSPCSPTTPFAPAGHRPGQGPTHPERRIAAGPGPRPRPAEVTASAADGRGAILLPGPVPQPLPGPLGLSVALVDDSYLLGPLKVRAADQPVGDEEFGQLALMVLFLPDPALKLLLVIRDRAIPAQVQCDDNLDHRNGLRCYRTENELLVVVGHGQASHAIAVEERANLGHRVGLRRAAAGGRG